jgi:hypothetical protein
MNKEKGLYVNSLGATFAAILRKARDTNTLGMKLEDIESPLDFVGHPILEDQLAEVVVAARDYGLTGDEIGLVFGCAVNELTIDSEEE